ncbi:uncharacterized protein LOC143206501 [Rhynchophorus ferrugineus]|uniref:Uncharacterized protein n=1 Tax=Rhynchophorus ferrugineus TaxID=354439 RepID=A0A834MF50_RHYFE|nr:hypothetical protein GWI33_006878 [Rhynchophorus ferrugineus]
MLIYYLGSLLFATSLMIVVFLFITSGNLKQFKENWARKAPRITELPIITPTGQIVNSVEDLDMQLEFLEGQLEDKEKELEETKSKQLATCERLNKLNDTTNQIKKYFLKLKSEMTKSESEIGELRTQIEDYKKRQVRLREEVNENVKYYTGMLNNIENTVACDGYEFVRKALGDENAL